MMGTSFAELYNQLTPEEQAIFDAEWETFKRLILRERDFNMWNWFEPWLDNVKAQLVDLILTIKSKFNQPFRGFRADGNQIGWRWLLHTDIKAKAIDTSGGTETTHLYREDYVGTQANSPQEYPDYLGFVLFGIEYHDNLAGFQYFDSKGYEHPPYFYSLNLKKFGAEFGWIPLVWTKEITPESRLGLALIIEGEVTIGTLKPNFNPSMS